MGGEKGGKDAWKPNQMRTGLPGRRRPARGRLCGVAGWPGECMRRRVLGPLGATVLEYSLAACPPPDAVLDPRVLSICHGPPAKLALVITEASGSAARLMAARTNSSPRPRPAVPCLAHASARE